MMRLYRFLLIFISLVFLLTCEYNRESFLTPLSPILNAKDLRSIEINRDSNPHLPVDGLTVINENEIVIYLSPDINSDTDSFILDIEAEGFDHFTLDGQIIQSGSTEIIFGHDVERSFAIHGDDASSTLYNLRVVETLIGQVFSYHPHNSSPTINPVYNSTAPFYVEFNSTIDPKSLDNGDFSLNGDFSIGSIINLNDQIFKVNVNSVNATPRVDTITLELKAGTVEDNDQSTIPVLNSNSCSSQVSWDSLPPGFNGSVEVEIVDEGDSNLELRLHAWSDSYFPQDELNYSLYYSEGSAPSVPNAPDLDMNNLNSGVEVLSDFNITSAYRDVNITGLQGQYDYNYYLLIQDKLGNASLYQYDHIQQTFVYVSIDNPNADNTGTGSIEEPFRDIQPALKYAHDMGINEVLVAEGIYTPVVQGVDYLGTPHAQISLRLYPEVALKGGYSYDFLQRYSIDPLEYPTIISGDLGGQFSNSLISHEWNIDNPPDNTALLEGFILEAANQNSGLGGAAIANTNHTFVVNQCVFRDLISLGSGGAIRLDDLNQDFIIRNSLFTRCESSSRGGAIALDNSTNGLVLENCIFTDNTGLDGGGALHIRDAEITIDATDFTSNETLSVGGMYFGGAISLFQSTAYIQGTSFQSNISQESGGAISSHGSNLAILETYFNGNKSFGSMGGGAIITYQNNNAFGFTNISNSKFIDCSTQGQGGAISIWNIGSVNNYFSKNLFDNNYASGNGGAIYIKNVDYLSIAEDYDSGAEFVSNSSDNNGGAIFSENCNLSINDLQFQSNSAINSGGAVAFHNNVLNLQRVILSQNSATDPTGTGGAIYLQGSLTSTEMDDMTFASNTAGQSGGALSLQDSFLTILNSSFIENILTSASPTGGGAMYVVGGTVNKEVTIDYCDFYENRSFDTVQNGEGGALFIANNFDNRILISNNNFENNASSMGGAMAVSNNGAGPSIAVTMKGNNYFQNVGYAGPGAIYLESQRFVEIISEIFVANESESAAPYQGAAITMNNMGSTLGSEAPRILQCIFYNNIHTGMTTHLTASGSVGMDDYSAIFHNSFFYEPKPPGADVSAISMNDLNCNVEGARNIFAGYVDVTDYIGTTPPPPNFSSHHNEIISNPSASLINSSPSPSSALDLQLWRDDMLGANVPFLIPFANWVIYSNKGSIGFSPAFSLPTEDITGRIRPMTFDNWDIGPYEYQP